MTASEGARRAGAAAMSCWPESAPTWGCDPACTFGWVWIGTWCIPRARCLCPFAVISALELQGSFGCTVKEGGTMNKKKLAVLALLVSIVSPVAQAQIKHIEM